MANMTDGNQIASMFNWFLNGASIGTQPTMQQYLLLMSANSANNKGGVNGTEMTNTNLPGYTGGGGHAGNGGGQKMAATAVTGFGTFSNSTFAAVSNSNAVSWSISGTQTANIVGVEIWDNNATTAVRLLTGSITAISGAASGDTIQFAAASISVNPTGW